MTMLMPVTVRRALGAAVACVACLAVLPASAAPPGPNLVTNAGFEDSAFEGNPLAGPGSLAQPILPTGWSFEGLTALFDHSPNVHHSGKRAAAISGSLSSPRTICQSGSCYDNPLNPVRDEVQKSSSLTPAWVTDAAIAVKPDTKYTLSTWLGWDLMTVGTSASTRVRWLDAGGKVLAEEVATTVLATAENSALLDWSQISKVLKSPAGAAGAQLMLTHGDDLWNSQVRYDDVYFGTAP